MGGKGNRSACARCWMQPRIGVAVPCSSSASRGRASRRSRTKRERTRATWRRSRPRGGESESRLPYASLYQLLRPALGALERIPRAQAAALESALGLREDAAPDLYRVPLAVVTLLAEMAEEGPLLCIVDAAQWIDHDSEQALVFAARRLHAEGAAMLFAAREREF